MKKSAIITTLVFLFIASPLVLADQSLIASKGISGLNIIPRIAVNTHTGDILVVWTNQTPGTTTLTTWARLFKRKANGTYAPKAAVRISDASGWNANAQAVYVPWRKQYFVFWDTYNFFNGLVPAKILARKLNKNGKTVGGIVTVVDDNRSNNWPRAVVTEDYRPKDLQDSDAVDMVYLTWSAFPTEIGDGDAGLKYVHIKNNMKQKGKPVVIEPVTIKTAAPVQANGRVSPAELSDRPFTTDATPTWNGFGIGYESSIGGFSQQWRYVDGDQPTARPEKVGPSNRFNDHFRGRTFPSPRAEGTIIIIIIDRGRPANPGRCHFFTPRTFNMGHPQYDLHRNVNKGRVRLSFDSSFTGNDSLRLRANYKDYGSRYNSNVAGPGLPDIQIGANVYVDGNKIKFQPLTMLNNGKLKFGTAQTILNHGNKIGWLETSGIPGSNDMAITWNKELNDSNREIRLNIVN